MRRWVPAAAIVGLLLAIPPAAQAAEEQIVLTAGYSYLPGEISIQARTRLIVRNFDVAAHSLTAVALKPETEEPLFDSGLKGIGQTGEVIGAASLAASTTGYPFRCDLHPGMRGTLFVTR